MEFIVTIDGGVARQVGAYAYAAVYKFLRLPMKHSGALKYGAGRGFIAGSVAHSRFRRIPLFFTFSSLFFSTLVLFSPHFPFVRA